MRILAEVPWEGRQATVGLSRAAIFSVFAGYFFRYFKIRPMLLHSDMQSIVGFSVISKCMTLNDLQWLFCIKLT